MERKKSSMDKPRSDLVYKILLLGDTAVGKTALLLSYCEDIYSDTHVATIGLDYRIKIVEVDNKKIKLNIWDTAGQDRFRSITQSYYRGAHGILLVYDVTSPTSFANIKQWVNQIRDHSPKDVVLMLVGNKVDSKDRVVTKYEGFKFAEERNMIYIETSAKEHRNIKEAFEMLYLKIYMEIPNMNKKKNHIKKISDNSENHSNTTCCN